MAAEDDGVLVAVLVEVDDAVLDGVLAGAAAGAGAGVAGAVLAVVEGSDVFAAASFFSPVFGAGASLPEDGFILSE
ncbi:MAG: hypothetical protein Q8L77_07135 [Nitrospirota bacterium]|nr:hypothetical protein [Nitrospirota bacterium]